MENRLNVVGCRGRVYSTPLIISLPRLSASQSQGLRTGSIYDNQLRLYQAEYVYRPTPEVLHPERLLKLLLKTQTTPRARPARGAGADGEDCAPCADASASRAAWFTVAEVWAVSGV